MEIILNLKLLSVKLFTDQPKLVNIDVNGECEVTAADIQGDDEVEIVNPELHIATLSAGAHLSMQITLETGRGYVSGGTQQADDDRARQKWHDSHRCDSDG